jgi:hypothetical protein
MIGWRARSHALVVVVAALALLAAAAAALASPQDGSATSGDYFMRDERRVPKRKPRRPRRPSRNEAKAARPERARPPAGPRLLAGDAYVDVTELAAAVAVDVGLAKGGVGHLEFPSSDPIYTINPGDETLVTIDQPQGRPMKPTDPVTFRPGSEFRAHEAKGAPLPAAQITVQLTSGLLVAVNVYPVRDLSRSITRVTFLYDRLAVVAARRAKGLSADLNAAAPVAAPAPPTAAVEPRKEPAAVEIPFNPAAAQVRSDVPRLTAAVEIGRGAPLLVAGKTPEEITHAELARAIEAPAKILSKFGAPTHGLQLAAGLARDVDAKHKLLVFAVRNATKTDIRLVPGQPDVYVETLDGEGRPVNIEHLEKVRTETTALERNVPAGGIVYYAVLFKTPVLGARQRLRISVSPMTAADEPAFAPVPASLPR